MKRVSSVAALQRLVAAVEGQMSLSVIGAGERRMVKLWFFRHGQDHLFSGSTLAEVLTKALGAINPAKCSRQPAA